jgi:hypothetical protein
MKTNQESLIETLEDLLLVIQEAGHANMSWEKYIAIVSDNADSALDLILRNREAGIIP